MKKIKKTKFTILLNAKLEKMLRKDEKKMN